VRLLLIDNYDSFTYNLVQYLGELGADTDVVRNDVDTAEGLLARGAAGLVISPGPGDPGEAGVSESAVRVFARAGVPVLGVCLGHQAIGAVFGGRIVRARALMHGKTSQISHDGRGVFQGLPSPFEATRYHSLVIEPASCPAELEIAARAPDGEIMAVRHRTLPVHGVQFHPESILTPEGKRLLANFMALCEARP
jgi:anthranilate synthase/aminodeoxychorismate synthase-like glutamine amidotransferase